jgi:hypothetical protein
MKSISLILRQAWGQCYTTSYGRNLRVRPEPTQVKRLSVAPLLAHVQALDYAGPNVDKHSSLLGSFTSYEET